ncbi:MAG: DoxX family protein [Dehalococcoidia bacterium]|nr:DoxX family protein [Dehalococcoidia bacterium]
MAPGDVVAGLDSEQRLSRVVPAAARRTWQRLDDLLVGFMKRHGIALLRTAVALVFLWFGFLKVADRSPVADLVAGTIYWLPASFFVRFLGAWEIVVGLGLLLPFALRLTLLLFWAQMAGTFLVLVVHPGLSFQSGNPLLLTMTGEFVIKNLVLITAGLVIGSTVSNRGPTSAAQTVSP